MNGTNTTTISIKEQVNPESIQYDNCSKQYRLIPTELRTNHYYVLWYINISNMVLTAILPLLLLIFLCYRTYTSLSRFNRRRPSRPENIFEGAGRESGNSSNDAKKTSILFSTVIVFICCHSLRILLNIEEFLELSRILEKRDKGCNGDAFKFWFSILVPVSHLFIIINSSVNFFIYSFLDPAFKRILRQAVKNMVFRNNRNHAEDIELPVINNNGDT